MTDMLNFILYFFLYFIGDMGEQTKKLSNQKIVLKRIIYRDRIVFRGEVAFFKTDFISLEYRIIVCPPQLLIFEKFSTTAPHPPPLLIISKTFTIFKQYLFCEMKTYKKG